MSIIDVLKGMFTPEEEMVSIEVIYEPEVKDTHGHWMSKEEVRKAAENFNENFDAGVAKANLFHLEETDKISILKTWINEELDVVVKGSDQELKAGTWVGMVKYHDKNLWELKKMGHLGGLSMGGKAYVDEETGEISGVDFSLMLGEGS